MEIKKIMKHILLVNLLSLMIMNSTVFALAPSKDVIENSKDLKELISIYRNNSNYASFSDNDIITVAREDWYEFSKIEAKKAMCFDSLPAEEVSINGTTYRLYGFRHGNDLIPIAKGYKNFVHKAYQIENSKITHSNKVNEGVSRSGFIIAEQGIPKLLNNKDDYFIDIKDHMCELKVNPNDQDSISSFIVGLFTSFVMTTVIPLCKTISYYPYSISDTFDAIGMEEFRSWMLGYEFAHQEHSMSIEIQEGLKKKLPSHLEIGTMLSKIKYDLNSDMSTTRSLYMTGFLKGFAENGNFKEVPFFMGRAHLAEVKAFLLDTNGHAENTEAYKLGKEKGSLLAQTILIAQKNDDKGIVDTIAAWNNPKSSSATLQEIYSDMPASLLLGIVVGLTAEAWLVYRLYNG